MERGGLIIALALAVLLAGCADVPELIVSQDTITVGVTEKAPVKIRVSSEPGESFSDIEASLGDSDIVSVTNVTYSQKTLNDGDVAQITFTVMGMNPGKETIPVTLEYDEGESFESQINVEVTEPGLNLGFADKKDSVQKGEQEEFSLQLQNTGDQTYGYVMINLTSNWPQWVQVEALPGWPTERTGETLVLPVQVPAKEDRRIPFYVIATPQANEASFTITHQLMYSSDGQEWAYLDNGSRTILAS